MLVLKGRNISIYGSKNKGKMFDLKVNSFWDFCGLYYRWLVTLGSFIPV